MSQLALWATAADAHAAITTLEQRRVRFLADLAEAAGLDDLELRPLARRDYHAARAAPICARGADRHRPYRRSVHPLRACWL
jgi:hypothetical protein